MDRNDQPIVAGVGEVLWDLFPQGRRPGGAPANVAFHAHQLGGRGVVCSRVGKDEPGRELVEYLRSRRLDPSFIQVDPGRPTGTVEVDTSRPDHPSFRIVEDVAWDRLEYTVSLDRLMHDAAAVVVGTLAQRSEGSRETIRRCLAAASGSLVVYDVNLRPPWYRRRWIERTLEKARIAKLNEDEARILAEMFDLSGGDLLRFGRDLAERFELELVCVTRGDRGCVLVTPAGYHEIAGIRVSVVDAVGAGDAFTAALVAARLDGRSLSAAGRFANRIGALVASRPGAMPDLPPEEVAEALDRAQAGDEP